MTELSEKNAEMMKEVVLTQGQVAIVDDEDFERVSKHKWSAKWSKETQSFYARTNIGSGVGNQKTVELQRFIMGCPQGAKVDHRSGDTLDCRRGNLRLATTLDSARNRGRHRDNTTGFLGVTLNRQRRYRAQIYVNGKYKTLGAFGTAEEAALVRDAAAREYFGEFGRLNFPNTNEISAF